MIKGATLPVVVCTPLRLNPGCKSPFNAAITTGKYSGKQPAITALAAIFAIEATPFNGGIAPKLWSSSNPLAFIISATASRVGGRTGRPSVQPFLARYSNIRAGFSGAANEPALTAPFSG